MGGAKKYFIFQDGADIMFVSNVPSEEIDENVVRSFKEEARARGLLGVIFPNVEEIIRAAKQGEAVRIGGVALQEEKQESQEAAQETEERINPDNLPFHIEISHDGMKAVLEVTDPSVPIGRKHIDVALQHVGIIHGVVKENIWKLLEGWPKLARITIAEGTHPEDGKDAELRLLKDFKDNLAPAMTEEGSVDFKQLQLISAIEAGDVLQVRTPPTEGVPGSDVFGKVIPATSGKDKKLQKGQNTEISEDGTKLVATEDGFLHLGTRGEINVRPVYTVNGDVAYSTGNVHYKADVLVKGDVRAGFSVKAGGDVHIYGAVEDARVEAGGSITINGGVLSSGKAVIKAGGDISVGFMQNATVEADGSVFIRIEAVGSTIKAGKDIEVMKREGRIVGGELQVGGWVVAQVIGSENCPPMRIEFTGSADGPMSPDQKYEHCFVSTMMLESPIDVHFGNLMAKISGIEPPLTISIKERKIVIENSFVGPDQLKQLRRQRDAKEHREDS